MPEVKMLSAAEWQPIATASKYGPDGFCHWLEGKLSDGSVVSMHYAAGDGDGLMPPFDGWFIKLGDWGFREVHPTHWRPTERAADADSQPAVAAPKKEE